MPNLTKDPLAFSKGVFEIFHRGSEWSCCLDMPKSGQGGENDPVGNQLIG